MFRIINICVILFRKFGFRLIYLVIPLYRFIYSVLYYVGYFADEIFFRKYRKKSITKPVFLVGHPRSGTTFIHKFLVKNCNEFEGMYLWRMIFPTLTSRFIIKPLLPIINKAFPKNLYDPAIHKTGFLEPETDDVALFFKSFEGMFSWLYFYALTDYNSIDELEVDLIKASKSRSMLLNLNTIFKKNLYHSDSSKRIFSKSFSLILNLNEIKELFSDAKIVILMRDPMEVVPSSLSLARNVQMNLNKFDKLTTEERNKYYRNLYYASILFYKNLFTLIDTGEIKKEELLIINYRDFIKDFEPTINRIIDYCEIEKTAELIEAIKNQSEKQPSYKGKHEYTLEEFGISKDEVLRDFSFVYSRFSFE